MAPRRFADSAGTVWEVFEVHRATEAPRGVSPGLEQGWLSFVSASGKRRLAPFPPAWEAASDGELERLCTTARIAAPARYPGTDRRKTPRDGSAPERVPDAARAVMEEAPMEDPDVSAVRDAVREFARKARAAKLPAVVALVRLKAVLTSRFCGEGVSPRAAAAALDLRRVRRWFVESYYFEPR